MADLLDTIVARFRSLSRRQVLLGGGTLAALGLVAASRPAKEGGTHDTYFLDLQHAVKEAGLARPTLVIDKTRLDHNIATLKSHLGAQMGYRIVAKSLPSVPLLEYVMRATGTDRLMVFHQPFLNTVASRLPGSDVLLGKPIPVAAAARFYDHLGPTSFDPARQLQWLIDTPERLEEYRTLANARDLPMRLNIELDVGLHRGGLTHPSELAPILAAIDADPLLTFSGFMGYDPHLASVPDLLGWKQSAFEGSTGLYKAFIEEAERHYGDSWAPETLTFNTAGSPTYQMHDATTHATELAVGSALVKPTHFDVPTLEDHQPASFITTPVLKKYEQTEIPALEALSGPTRLWDPNTARTFFIYGGNWLADPVSPPGLRTNGLFGRSSNQEMLNGSNAVGLDVGDYVVFRPTQSEFVFLQFGDIALYEDGAIVGNWPVFTQGA
ncbi:MAG: DSD1 family PLP-dependent enzyme [Parvibaculaceae bacterium]